MSSSAYTAGVGSILAPGAVDKLVKNAWELKSSAATDAGVLLARADRTVGKLRTALLVSALVTAISTGCLIKGALAAGRGF